MLEFGNPFKKNNRITINTLKYTKMVWLCVCLASHRSCTWSC